jgi:histidinol-phosphate aminotransferase
MPSPTPPTASRTFAKSYGLAAVRIGAVIGAAEVIARLRRSLPPYSINVLAATVLSAALNDREHVNWYRQQVERSRALVYDACDRLGLHYWRSHANFVLVRVGDDAPAIVDALAARKIFVRDRSTQPGCAGCIRITTGVVEHTEACLAALEEVLCARA